MKCKKIFLFVLPLFAIPLFAHDTLECIFDYEFQTPMGEREIMSIRQLGDINADGYDDWAYVFHDENVFYTKDSVWLFFGGNPIDFTPDHRLFAHDAGYIGDVNGDGYEDMAYLEVIIDNKYITSTPLLYVLHGGPQFDFIPDDTCSIFAYSTRVNFSPIGTIGDINGDGKSDIYCGLSYDKTYVYYGADSAKQYIFLGDDNISTIADIILYPPPFVNHDTSNIYFCWGESYSSMGDINDDGFDDFFSVYEAVDHNVIYRYMGSNDPSTIANNFDTLLYADTLGVITYDVSSKQLFAYLNFGYVEKSKVGIYDLFDTIPKYTYGNIDMKDQVLGDINGDGLNDWVIVLKNPYQYRGCYGSVPDEFASDFTLPPSHYPSITNIELMTLNCIGDVCGDGYDKLLVIKSNKALSSSTNDDDVIYHAYCYSYDIAGADTEPVVPIEHRLENIYPNPFNPVTRIDYYLSEQGNVDISIYDIQGKIIKNLVNELKPAGEYSQNFNAQELSSGIYFATLKVNDRFISTKKMLYMK